MSSEEKKARNWVLYLNTSVLVLLLATMLSIIFLGSIVQHFTREWRTRSDNAIEQRKQMIKHDSLQDVHIENVLENQIESHKLYHIIIIQNDSLIKLQNKYHEHKSVN